MPTEDCPVCKNVNPQSCGFCKGKGIVEAKGVTHVSDGKTPETPATPAPSNIAKP